MTNLVAFLDTIAYSEGTDKPGQPTKDRGYDVLVGGGLFTGYADHPRKLIDLPRLGIKSTAAGRYQILARYYDVYKAQLGLPDFSPTSQDKIAVQLIRECKALDDIDTGRITEALRKCRSRWASLPGAGYGQHEHKVDTLIAVFKRRGGVIV
jgi:muramidase (phage lysozyme)